MQVHVYTCVWKLEDSLQVILRNTIYPLDWLARESQEPSSCQLSSVGITGLCHTTQNFLMGSGVKLGSLGL